MFWGYLNFRLFSEKNIIASIICTFDEFCSTKLPFIYQSLTGPTWSTHPLEKKRKRTPESASSLRKRRESSHESRTGGKKIQRGFSGIAQGGPNCKFAFRMFSIKLLLQANTYEYACDEVLFNVFLRPGFSGFSYELSNHQIRSLYDYGRRSS